MAAWLHRKVELRENKSIGLRDRHGGGPDRLTCFGAVSKSGLTRPRKEVGTSIPQGWCVGMCQGATLGYSRVSHGLTERPPSLSK